MVCSARNDRQLGVIADEVEYRLKQDGHRPRRREGEQDTGWLLLDYGTIVVHVFTEEQRDYYDLERLWRDAPTTTFDGTPAGAASASDERG